YDVDAISDHSMLRSPGVYRTRVKFPGGILNTGFYQIRLGIARHEGTAFDYCEPFTFQISDRGNFGSLNLAGRSRPGVLALLLDWTTEKIA
ncbi:MAG: hypothetical protein ACXWC7_20590, partial [Chitinophagaceae bacterium]